MPGDGTSEVTPQHVPEEISKSLNTWAEVRDYYLKTPYSEHVALGLGKIKEWEATPRTPVDQNAWNTAIDQQIDQGRQLMTSYPSQNVSWTETNKVVAKGKELPRYGQETLTRVYLGVDPRKASDAYKVLLDELDRFGVLKDIEASLNTDELAFKKLTGNTIVLYEPLSRPAVLDSILEAYRAAKIQNPELFELSPRQKAFVMRENLQQFKATIDANMSFVEMAPEEGGISYDTNVVNEIRKGFGFNPGSLTDEEFLASLKQKEQGRVVWTWKDQQRHEKDEVKSGDLMHYKRKMTAPALIQTGTVTVQ